MPDIPALTTALITGETLEMSVAGDDFITVTEWDFDDSSPETRTNIGVDRFYTHGAPDLELSFICEGAVELLARLNALRVRDANNTLPTSSLILRLVSKAGVVNTFTVNAQLIRNRFVKSRGEQQEFVQMHGMFRISDTQPTVSRPSSGG